MAYVKDENKGKFLRLNNVSDATQLESGELSSAMNVDLALKGIAIRRPGFTKISTLAFHSLFSDDVSLYAVKTSQLCRDYAPFFALNSNATMSFTPCDNGWIAFTNGTDIGYIEGGTAHLFTDPPTHYLNEASVEVETFKEKLPAGKFVAYLQGMLLSLVEVGDETWLMHTDAWDMDGYNTTENFLRWKGQPKMLIAVDNGVWVGAGDRISYVEFGENGSELPVAEYAAVPYTAQAIDVKKAGFELQGETCVVFATEQGICVGGNGGTFVNLSQGTVSLPEASTGAGIIKEEDGRVTYICNLLSDGSEYNPRSDRPLELI